MASGTARGHPLPAGRGRPATLPGTSGHNLYPDPPPRLPPQAGVPPVEVERAKDRIGHCTRHEVNHTPLNQEEPTLSSDPSPRYPSAGSGNFFLPVVEGRRLGYRSTVHSYTYPTDTQMSPSFARAIASLDAAPLGAFRPLRSHEIHRGARTTRLLGTLSGARDVGNLVWGRPSAEKGTRGTRALHTLPLVQKRERRVCRSSRSFHVYFV